MIQPALMNHTKTCPTITSLPTSLPSYCTALEIAALQKQWLNNQRCFSGQWAGTVDRMRTIPMAASAFGG